MIRKSLTTDILVQYRNQRDSNASETDTLFEMADQFLQSQITDEYANANGLPVCDVAFLLALGYCAAANQRPSLSVIPGGLAKVLQFPPQAS